jgi:thiol-disulfide isomerase/thioredoxin
MNKSTKYLALGFAFFVFSNFACTQNKEQEQTKQAVKETTAIASAKIADNDQKQSDVDVSKVFLINSVEKNSEGKIPDFSWKEGDRIISFSQIAKNKVVFLNFWGTWCPPCRKEIPDIIQIHNELSNKNFVIIGIALERPNLNEQQAHSLVKDFAKLNKIPYTLVVNSAKNDLAQAFGGIPAVPTTYIIGKDGTIKEKIVGGRDKNSFMEAINKYLK